MNQTWCAGKSHRHSSMILTATWPPFGADCPPYLMTQRRSSNAWAIYFIPETSSNYRKLHQGHPSIFHQQTTGTNHNQTPTWPEDSWSSRVLTPPHRCQTAAVLLRESIRKASKYQLWGPPVMRNPWNLKEPDLHNLAIRNRRFFCGYENGTPIIGGLYTFYSHC